MKIYVAHASSFPYEKSLYTPIMSHPMSQKHVFVFPHLNAQNGIDARELIKTCDLMLAEVSLPSLGEGIELGWASAAHIPITCLHEKGTHPSRSLRHICTSIQEYSDVDELLRFIENIIDANFTGE